MRNYLIVFAMVFVGLCLSSSSFAGTYYVETYSAWPGEADCEHPEGDQSSKKSLRGAIQDACAAEGNDTIYFRGCDTKNKVICLNSTLEIPASCQGTVSILNDVEIEDCSEEDLDTALRVKPSPQFPKGNGLIDVKRDDTLIRGLNFSGATAISIDAGRVHIENNTFYLTSNTTSGVWLYGNASETIVTANRFDNDYTSQENPFDVKGVALEGGGVHGNYISNNQFKDFGGRSDYFIKFYQKDGKWPNRAVLPPTDVYATLYQGKFQLLGKADSPRNDGRIEMSSADSSKALYEPYGSFKFEDDRFDFKFDSSLGFQVGGILYIVGHYYTGDGEEKETNSSTFTLALTVKADGDGDGYPEEADCDDSDPAHIASCCREPFCDNDTDAQVIPLEEEPSDGGEGTPQPIVELDTDQDDDGYAAVPDGHGSDGDCNDNDPAINPAATEVCDSVDNDCDGKSDEDNICNDTDNDGDGYTENQGDCDDNNFGVNPGATESCSDTVDNDCDGLADSADPDCVDTGEDSDGDGSPDTVDCNPNDAAIYPGATEVCDSVDNNCDGQTDEGDVCVTPEDDADGDGYTESQDDCNDANPATYPGATELCEDLSDNDCDGDVDEGCEEGGGIDEDGDSFGPPLDCNDADPAVNPLADEVAGNGIDDNCDGFIDEESTDDADDDGDGYIDNGRSGGNDCNDSDASVNPGASEIADDGIDNDCDLQVDESTDEGPTDGEGDGEENGATEEDETSPPPTSEDESPENGDATSSDEGEPAVEDELVESGPLHGGVNGCSLAGEHL